MIERRQVCKVSCPFWSPSKWSRSATKWILLCASFEFFPAFAQFGSLKNEQILLGSFKLHSTTMQDCMPMWVDYMVGEGGWPAWDDDWAIDNVHTIWWFLLWSILSPFPCLHSCSLSHSSQYTLASSLSHLCWDSLLVGTHSSAGMTPGPDIYCLSFSTPY